VPPTAGTTHLVALDGLTKRYPGGVTALDALTVTIEQVERVITGELEFVAGELQATAEARAAAAAGVIDAPTPPPG
jgi:hypothetical protein